MSQMLPEGGEVMRRVACGDVCPAPPPAPSPHTATPTRSENKELLRQQLLSASKERLNAEKPEPPKPKHPRSRQKNRWKLKFHHQALPQEYLDHYEQSLQRAGAKPAPPKQPKPDKPDKADKPKREPSGAPADEAFKLWAQRLAAAPAEAPDERKRGSPAVAPSKVLTFEDLPYMGEMTLDEAKPRRGRKPKKADICHLIYENYGTVVPGRPPPTPAPPRSAVQHRLMSSLLGRKLSAEGRRLASPAAPRPAAPPTLAGPLHSDDEPLNLCVRDLRELKLQIREKFGDIYAAPDVKREPEQPNAISVIQRNTNPPAEAGWAPLVHPLALQAQLLCYQRLAAARLPAAEAPSPPSPAEGAPGGKLVLKRISELLEPAGAARAKRKRSALFIPPAPAAEVSICKFKFTGGSKPTLQEKKMLSVDAGGNFRYYSGGARAAKGPEPAPAPRPAPAPSARKRKSRKSLQREQLERTFKEKGFLIQTQQRQSAEGATYCKFRQLRKFTRYLFRSWKDHLPSDAGCG